MAAEGPDSLIDRQEQSVLGDGLDEDLVRKDLAVDEGSVAIEDDCVHRRRPLQRLTVQHSRLRLRRTFESPDAQDIDVEPVLHGELYAPLREPDFFARVALDPEARTLVWPNGADFDPATLHDWPKNRDAMRRLAQRWVAVNA